MTMSGETAEVRLSIGSRFENIELVQAVLDDTLRAARVDEDGRYWIGTAVREALANAIKHGNREESEKKVEVEVGFEASTLLIRVTDQGAGFDLEGVEDPLEPENLLKADGRGIFYMKKFMDGIEYTFAPEGGTTVALRKKLA
jgi:serine/threonine-protein kinase RsbW